jgi:NAD(P)-dependent dehydrogenase (short-subunit alcohol dehydrogenase family)
MRGLSGRVAVVTGAAGGIGRATAERLAEEGATVVCVDLASPRLDELSDLGSVVPLDVTDRAAVANAFDQISARFGSVDVLVNAHGLYQQGADGQGPVEASTPEDWERVLAVNLMGVVHTSEAALAQMKRRRYGRIVSISSAAAVVGGNACGAAYAVSKAGVTCFMKCVAREGAGFGVTANAVAPGQIDTAMTDVVTQRVPLATIVSSTPLGRLGAAEEVASAIAFLSSDDASFITGQMLGVNGGLLMV